MARIVLSSLGLLASLATCFRARLSKKAAGRVDSLYTYGAPGSASPGFLNPNRGDGCFPGERAWAGRIYLNLTGTADAVPQITHVLGYRHPMMSSVEYDVRNGYTIRRSAC